MYITKCKKTHITGPTEFPLYGHKTTDGVQRKKGPIYEFIFYANHTLTRKIVNMSLCVFLCACEREKEKCICVLG